VFFMPGLRRQKQITYARSKLQSENTTEIRRIFERIDARVAERKRAHPDLVELHGHSFRNSSEVRASAMCGCFACLNTFPSGDIVEWWDRERSMQSESNLACTDEGMTAVCPRCGFDAVLGNQCGRELTGELLAQMQKMWFAEPETIRLKVRTK
jgi:hypothetical protein